MNVKLYEMPPDRFDEVRREGSLISATIRRDIQQEAVPHAVTHERDSGSG